MTVRQLKRKLDKMPEEALVILHNSHIYNTGDYKATDVKLWDDGEVMIETDYVYIKNYITGKWEK